MLALSLEGLCAGAYHYAGTSAVEAAYFSNIDIAVQIEKTPKTMIGQAKLSEVRIDLKYTTYLCLMLVLRQNLGKKVDRNKWDNVEVAWEEEASRSDDFDSVALFRFSRDVEYSSSARHVRFGQNRTPGPKTKALSVLDFQLQCGKLSLLLLRDDDVTAARNIAKEMALFCINGLEFTAKRREDASLSITASAGKIFVFDIAERSGKCQEQPAQQPLNCSVLVEGYSGGSDAFDSQVVVTLDKAGGNSSIGVVVNYLSLAALIRPIEDIAAFFACDFPATAPTAPFLNETGLTHSSDAAPSGQNHDSFVEQQLQLRFVLHYPRLIFAADENDVNARALVLQG